MEDIFGSEAKKELGLVDAVSRDEFDAVLESLYPVWTKRELEVRKLTNEESTEFLELLSTLRRRGHEKHDDRQCKKEDRV